MSKFKLVCEDEAIPFGGASKITHEFECEDLGCILSNMTKFLQAADYFSGDQQLELGRSIDFNEDLDNYTESLFNPGAVSGGITASVTSTNYFSTHPVGNITVPPIPKE